MVRIDAPAFRFHTDVVATHLCHDISATGFETHFEGMVASLIHPAMFRFAVCLDLLEAGAVQPSSYVELTCVLSVWSYAHLRSTAVEQPERDREHHTCLE